MNSKKYTIILFYKFIRIENPEKLMEVQRTLCEQFGLTGRVLIAKEGINVTLEGTEENIKKYTNHLKSDELFKDIVIKESNGNGDAFPKLKIKVRDEIVTLGAGLLDPTLPTGEWVTAEELHTMYEKNEDFIVLDLRNDYEIISGKFNKSINLGLKNFRDLPSKISTLKKYKDKKIIAVCTGGIRVDKACRYLKQKGFDMYQLKDGIHTYMEKFPGKYFKGTLYVFDNRMITDVVREVPEKEIIGTCKYCDIKTEQYYSDDSTRPSSKVLCCNECYENHKEELRVAVAI